MVDARQTQQTNVDAAIQARFKELPKVVQNAITSADVQKELRQLADTEKLHLDQWQLLENNVMLTLLGFQPPEEFAKNLQEDLDISSDRAADLARDVSHIVFEPIRQELERALEHPEAEEKEETGVEAVRDQVLGQQPIAGDPEPAVNAEKATSNELGVTSSVQPATPPSPPPDGKTIRMPASGAYKPGEASSERKDVHDDPYREPPA